jgi:hypothetical protein
MSWNELPGLKRTPLFKPSGSSLWLAAVASVYSSILADVMA